MRSHHSSRRDTRFDEEEEELGGSERQGGRKRQIEEEMERGRDGERGRWRESTRAGRVVQGELLSHAPWNSGDIQTGTTVHAWEPRGEAGRGARGRENTRARPSARREALLLLPLLLLLETRSRRGATGGRQRWVRGLAEGHPQWQLPLCCTRPPSRRKPPLCFTKRDGVAAGFQL
ncbi:unnamed protein product [Lampetra planeri]